jgi:hypothetical protein
MAGYETPASLKYCLCTWLAALMQKEKGYLVASTEYGTEIVRSS